MPHEEEIRAGLLELKSPLAESLRRRRPRRNDLVTYSSEVFCIPHLRRAEFNGRIIHRIGIKAVLHIIQIFDHLRVRHRITDAKSRHTPRFRERLNDDHIVILVYERQSALCSEIHISFVDYDHAVRICGCDLPNRVERENHAGRRVRIRENDPPVLLQIVSGHDVEILIERLRLVRYAEEIRPDIIEAVRDVREKDRLLRIKERQKAHRKHIIRSDAGKDLFILQPIRLSDRMDQFLRFRIRIETHASLRKIPERLHHIR